MSHSRSRSSIGSQSGVTLPNLNHRVGTLNGEKRFKEFQDIARFNLIMAKKLIDTKSIVNYDEHNKHATR